MQIFVGSDHKGFYLKEKILAYLSKSGYQVEDVGDKVLDPNDDYPQFAYAAAAKVLGSTNADPRAILLCGGGQGMCIAANRIRGIRAVVIWDEIEARMARNDNDSNVLCLPSRVLEDNEKKVLDIIDIWLRTPFSKAPRHARRMREIEDLYG